MKHARSSRRKVAALAVLPVLLSLIPVAAASAADGGQVWKKAQAKVDYTVYRPADTAGLSRTFFKVYPTCSAGGDPLVQIEYGDQATSPNITIDQSQRECLDRPDEEGPAGTFTVRGATAMVFGRCIPAKGSCESATREGVRQSASTYVTLPSGGGQRTSTFVAVDTQGLTFAEIKRLVRSLAPVEP